MVIASRVGVVDKYYSITEVSISIHKYHYREFMKCYYSVSHISHLLFSAFSKEPRGRDFP